MDIYLLLGSLCLSLYLMGVHWTFQLIHFPLLSRVGVNEFQDYQVSHQKRILWSVRIPRAVAIILGVLLILFEPSFISQWALYAYLTSLVLAAAISFQFIRPLQISMTRQGYNAKMIRMMTRLYWGRTILSTVGAIILVISVVRLLNTLL